MKKIAEFYTMYRILIAIVVLLVHTRHHFTLCLRSAFYIVLKLSHIMFSLFFSYVFFYFFPLSCRLFCALSVSKVLLSSKSYTL